MAYRYRRYGRARSGYSRSRRAFGYRRFRYSPARIPRPYQGGRSLSRRTAYPRTITMTNTWDGGTWAVNSATDAVGQMSVYLASSGLASFGNQFAQYRIEEFSVTITPGWNSAPINAFPGGVGATAQPYIVSAVILGDGNPPATGVVSIQGMDNALKTDGTRVHRRTFRPAPSNLVYNLPLPAYGHPGGVAGLRSGWLSMSSSASCPHGVLYVGIRASGNTGSAGGYFCSFRITYSVRVSFRGFRGDLIGAAPSLAAAEPPPPMLVCDPPDGWTPPPDPREVALPAAGGAGASVLDEDSAMSAAVEEFASRLVAHRTDAPLRSTPGTRAAAARKAASSGMNLFPPKA